MPLRLEIQGIKHPYKLCVICNDALGWNEVVFEPGAKNSRSVYVCHEHLGDILKDFGDTVARMIEQEKGEDG